MGFLGIMRGGGAVAHGFYLFEVSLDSLGFLLFGNVIGSSMSLLKQSNMEEYVVDIKKVSSDHVGAHKLHI